MEGQGSSASIVDGQCCLVGLGSAAVGHALAQVVSSRRAHEVTHLDLSGNNLERLPDLASFTSVGTLVLDKNQLSGKLRLPCLKSVDTVWINSNKLDNLEQMIKDLKSLPGLRYLSAMKNPCVPDCFSQGKDLRDHARYRHRVIYMLGSLTFLDDQPITDDERREAAQRGSFSKTASPREPAGGGSGSAAAIDSSVDDVEDDSHVRKSNDSKAYLGYSPYKHLAHDSEGNRTIGSSDL